MTDDVHLFSYGTLQRREVQLATFGRTVPGTPDAIAGFELGELLIADPAVVATSGAAVHPILVPSADPAAEVPGVVFAITSADLAAADEYEVDDYVRVEVHLRSGLRAWVYVVDADRAMIAAGPRVG